MRLIGTLASHDDAQRFGDYLLSIGMRNHVEPAQDGQSSLVWIEHDDHLEQGQLQFRQYQANPTDPRYDEARTAAKQKRVMDYQAAERRRRQFTDVRTSWSGVQARPTPVSIAIIVICVIVAALTGTGLSFGGGGRQGSQNVSALMATTPIRILNALLFEPPDAADKAAEAAGGERTPMTMFSAIAHGQVWRLVTPMLLHFGLLHLLFNMSWVVTLGRMIEVRKGSIFLLVLVLGSSVISNSVEGLWAVYGLHAQGWQPFGGFSGVNYALFGYAWMKGRYQPYDAIGVGPQTVGMMVAWLFLCMTGMLGPVANAAHVGGILVGVIVGAWPALMRKLKAAR